VKKLCIPAIFFICISSYADGKRVVRVGAFNFYPGIFMDSDGEIKGFYVDALADVSRRENIVFKYVWGSWNEGLERIKSGEVDILTSVAYTPERGVYLDYCKTPILTVWSELYVLLNSEIDSITDIQGKKVALMKGDFNARSFIDLSNKFHFTFIPVEVDSFDEVFRALTEKKADAGVVNCTFGAARQKEFGIRSTGVVFNPFDIYFASAKGKNKDIINLLDSYLDKWKHQESSVFNRSRQKWSHGNIGAIEIIPEWVTHSLAVLGLMALLFISFTVILKIKVRRATEDIIQRQNLLKQSESKLRSYIDNSPDGIFVVDNEGRYLEVNPAASKITGYSKTELLSMRIPDLMKEQYNKFFTDEIEELNKKGYISRELEFFHKDGSIRWGSIDAVRLSENCFLAYVKDITGRRSDEEKIQKLLNEKELLLREVHHRIKNNMNTVKALLTLQIFNLKDQACINPLTDAESRLHSMMVLYDKLFCSENYRELPVKEYIEDLAKEIIFNFPNREIIKFKMIIDDFILSANILAPLGIIINELLTNIMKHAFTGKDNGVITITASAIENYATLTIHDDGHGLPEYVNLDESTGFGLNLVYMLMEQLGGNIDIERKYGTKFILRFKFS